MSGQTTLSFWQLLLVTLLPASLTALVALASPLIIEWRKQDIESKKKKAERFELLLQKLFESEHWIERFRAEHLFGSTTEPGINPFSMVEATIGIHFPQFQPMSNELRSKTQNYMLWIVTAGGKRANGDYGAVNEGFQDVYKTYKVAFRNLESLLMNFGQKEFGSGK